MAHPREVVRYFLDQDNDSHWYCIPLERRESWDAFCDLDTEDEESWNAPEWAKPLDGHPNGVTFENPSI